MDNNGKMLGDHQDRITKIETSLAIMVKVMWVIVTCSVGIIATAFYRLILR